MPWRLLVSIVIFAVFLTFITFNLENRCDVSFGFTAFSNVPVFLTVFASFTLGLACSFPLAIHLNRKHKESPKPKEKKPSSDEKKTEPSSEIIDARAARAKFIAQRHGDNDK